jgi:hypothetical protein
VAECHRTLFVDASCALMTERRGRDLEQWMPQVTAGGDPALWSFVTGLRRDQDAADVWPRQPRPAPPPRPPRRLTIKESITETVPEPEF